MNFDKYADNYDAGWKGTKSARFYDDLIREVEINTGDSVLDVGCGTGTVLSYISSKTDISGFGLDISEKMLNLYQYLSVLFIHATGYVHFTCCQNPLGLSLTTYIKDTY